MDKPLIICIIGESGSGKTEVAKYLEQKHQIPMISSYTDRPPRHPGELGHTFVSKKEYDCFKKEDMIAHTNFGDYRYCCLKKDVNPFNTYVIDEYGYIYLLYHFMDEYNIKSIRIRRNIHLRRKSVTKERILRDEQKFNLNGFDYEVNNNGTLEELYTKLDKVLELIKEEKSEEDEDFWIEE